MTGTVLSGVGGRLFPLRYLSDRLRVDEAADDAASTARQQVRLVEWWRRVEARCGPATGLRTLFDIAAMPLFALLGFRAVNATFEREAARACLMTRGRTPVALLILPWASRPSSVWKHAVEAATATGADWCFVLAPPFLSLVAARGQAIRRSVDFSFPHALGPASIAPLLALSHEAAFDRSASGRARIDTLVAAASAFQDGVRSDLQEGVVEALAELQAAIAERRGPGTAPFDEALTLLYRILFLLFAEARDLVPRHHPVYRSAYSLATLCRDARQAETAEGLWDGLAAITRLSRTGCRIDDLIVRPFNGRLFARHAAPCLEAGRSARRRSRSIAARDAALRRSLVALATRQTSAGREEICYADLGVEQLGAVYERVLDLDPAELQPPRSPAPARRGGGHSDRRKQSGTFYTPRDLAEFVVRRTLAPLVAGRTPDQILSLRVVDPAMGSGAFLVAACRFLAMSYERALLEEGRCSTADMGASERVAMRRLVAERCLAGVDVNPVAVQLARLSLWLATLAEGKPLSFLDHRLRTGNSLVGASPEDLWRTGDRARRSADSLPLFDAIELEYSLRLVTKPLIELAVRPDDTVADVRAKEAIWSQLAGRRSPLAAWRHASSLWCARWFWDQRNGMGPPPSGAELRAALDALLKHDSMLRTPHLARWLAASADLETAHGFFHWPLEFADVFYDESGRPKDRAGFDAVIGNPPWEVLRHDGQALVRFVRESGLFPSCDRGHLNLYQPFLERALSLARTGGRVGLVLPWGLASDDGAAALRARLFDRSSIDTIVGLDNAHAIFPIHRGLRFVVVVATPGGTTRAVRGRFGVTAAEDIAALPDAEDRQADEASYPVRLSRESLHVLGGTTHRIPDLRRPDDVTWLEPMWRGLPRLGAREGWGLQFGRELNATEDQSAFGSRGLPVLEGKHIGPFVADTGAATRRIEPAVLRQRLRPARFMEPRLAYRDVSGVSNRLSLIAAIIPGAVVTTHTLFCLRTAVPLERQHFLCGLFNSYVLNAVVRTLMGGHLTTSLIEDLPVPIWTGAVEQRRIARLARRLSRSPGHAALHASLQAAVARLYAFTLGPFTALLETFPLVPAAERQRARDALAARLRYSAEP